MSMMSESLEPRRLVVREPLRSSSSPARDSAPRDSRLAARRASGSLGIRHSLTHGQAARARLVKS